MELWGAMNTQKKIRKRVEIQNWRKKCKQEKDQKVKKRENIQLHNNILNVLQNLICSKGIVSKPSRVKSCSPVLVDVLHNRKCPQEI